jgi:hypothetical protein
VASRSCLVLIAIVFASATSLDSESLMSSDDVCNPSYLKSGQFGDATYQQRTLAYCDGRVAAQYGGSGELPIIGVTATAIDGDLAVNPLQIIAFQPASSSEPIAWPLHVHAQARQPTANYRLDGRLQAQAPLTVGRESGLAKAIPPLKPSDIAWCAWSDSAPHGRTYYPVGVKGSHPQAIEIVVRPGLRAATITYSVMEPGQTQPPTERSINGNDRSGVPVTISIVLSNSPVVNVSVTAIALSGQTQAATLRIVMPGRNQ